MDTVEAMQQIKFPLPIIQHNAKFQDINKEEIVLLSNVTVMRIR